MGELAAILVVGILAQWVAWKIKTPAILPLIIFGLIVGPLSTFITSDGHKFLDTTQLFKSDIFFDFVALSVGIILFEGGLTLRFKEVKHHVSTIRNLLIFGSIITLLGGAFAAHYILDISLTISFLFGALVIVTGPTVIRPILQNVKPTQNISTVLKWEGVLIDPVGAFTTVLIYEFIVSGGAEGSLHALGGFFMIILSGSAIGAIMAYFTYLLLRQKWAPHYLKNTIVLAIVIFTYAFSDHFHEESGLLAVTIMGIIISNSGLKDVKEILSFKEDITMILISMLFIALSSRIDVSDIQMLGWKSLMVLLILIFVIRPIGIFLSAAKSEKLSFKEKLFISYISPRGIISAGIASVFAIKLSSGDVPGLTPQEIQDAELLLPLTFMVILGTVILQGSTAKYVSKLLGVQRAKEKGIIFVGANEISRYLAKILMGKKIPVLLTDTSIGNIKETRMEGIEVHHGSVITEDEFDDYDFDGFGQLLAITPNTEINRVSCKVLGEEFGKNNTYRIASKYESELRDFSVPKNVLFNDAIEFNGLIEIIRKKPQVHIKFFSSLDSLRTFVHPGITEIIPLLVENEVGDFFPYSGYVFDQVKEGNLYFIYKSAHTSIEPFVKKK
jgi:NhaP-type Na+/H+ or K+/H+ antiporter